MSAYKSVLWRFAIFMLLQCTLEYHTKQKEEYREKRKKNPNKNKELSLLKEKFHTQTPKCHWTSWKELWSMFLHLFSIFISFYFVLSVLLFCALFFLLHSLRDKEREKASSVDSLFHDFFQPLSVEQFANVFDILKSIYPSATETKYVLYPYCKKVEVYKMLWFFSNRNNENHISHISVQLESTQKTNNLFDSHKCHCAAY